MALAMAKNGGIGVLHRNLDAETQAAMIKWVRKKVHYDGMIDKPITFGPDQNYSEVIFNSASLLHLPIVRNVILEV